MTVCQSPASLSGEPWHGARAAARTLGAVFTGIDAPAGVRTGDLLLRPLTADDAELDHAAVMESREFLRAWEQSTWPADDFTVEANRADLMMLEQRHADGTAFTYTVMGPDQTECLGCVYLLSPDAKMFAGANITDLDAHPWSSCDATVFFWVRASRLDAGLDRTLLDVLLGWLDREWSFDAPVFVTNEQFDQQVRMLDASGLRRRFVIRVPEHAGPYLAYGS